MNQEDLNNTVRNSLESIRRWEQVKSTPNIQEIETYQQELSDMVVAVNDFEQFAEDEVGKAKSLLNEAKKLKRNLTMRSEQAKRVYWNLRNSQPKI